MSWLEFAIPVRMRRVALVAPADALRDVLVRVADTATVEIGPPAGDGTQANDGHGYGGSDGTEGGEAARRLARLPRQPFQPALMATRPDLDALERDGRQDLLAGEAQLETHAATAVRRSGAAAVAGWIPASKLGAVTAELAKAGGTVIPLPPPPGVQPPTLVTGPPLRRSVSAIVRTYGTVPYADIDPAWLAWTSYVLMFGMMFGDAGEGALLIAAAAALRAGWPRWARRFQRAWPFAGGAGIAATMFGLAYGSFFGPTGLIPALWVNPLDDPVTLLIAATGFGAALLAGAYALGTVNRWREGGWPSMLYAPSGAAGAGLFLGIGLAAGGWYFHIGALLVAGGCVAFAGLALATAGFLAESGGGGSGVVQAAVELFDMIVRLGSNVVSFTRLAAFGLTHAALGLVVWRATLALWPRDRLWPGGVVSAAGAVGIFAVGTALAFSLEALVAAVQALRLEYYELFSRVFVTRGRPFRPWRVPTAREENAGPAGAGTARGGAREAATEEAI